MDINIVDTFYVTRTNGKRDKKVRYECSECKRCIETMYHNIPKLKGSICKSCRNKETGILKRGLPNKTKGIPRKHISGENHPKWKGGRYVNKQGYVMVNVKSGSIDRASGWQNYRPEHIVVIEKEIGRSLQKDECVHHIDGDRQNNNISNLFLSESNRHHKIVHHSLQKIGYELYKNGIIGFNKITGEYILEA